MHKSRELIHRSTNIRSIQENKVKGEMKERKKRARVSLIFFFLKKAYIVKGQKLGDKSKSPTTMAKAYSPSLDHPCKSSTVRGLIDLEAKSILILISYSHHNKINFYFVEMRRQCGCGSEC